MKFCGTTPSAWRRNCERIIRAADWRSGRACRMLGNCSCPFCPKRTGQSPESEISSQRCNVDVESRFGFSAFLTTGAALVSSKVCKKRIPAMYHFTALVTCLAIAFYFFTSIQVSKARVAFGIKVPAITGNPDFERVFRVQMNTLEWMPIFLPSLWLFAIYISDAVAAVLGLVWIAGRILYMTAYAQAASKRGRGFGIQASATIVLWLAALGAIVWRLAHG